MMPSVEWILNRAGIVSQITVGGALFGNTKDGCSLCMFCSCGYLIPIVVDFNDTRETYTFFALLIIILFVALRLLLSLLDAFAPLAVKPRSFKVS